MIMALVAFIAVVLAILLPTYVVNWNWGLWKLHTEALLPKFQLWLFSLMVQVGIWVFSVALIVQLYRGLTNHYPLSRSELFILASIASLLFLIAEARTIFHQSPSRFLKGVHRVSIRHLQAFSVPGILVAAFAVSLMVFVWKILGYLNPNSDSGSTFAQLLEMKQILEQALVMTTLILAAAVLSFALLRNAVNAEDESHPISAEYVILYGALNSCIILLVYGLVRWRFVSIGVALVDHRCGTPPIELSALAKWCTNREKLTSALALDFTGLESLGGLLASVAPLVVSWISTLLGTQKSSD